MVQGCAAAAVPLVHVGPILQEELTHDQGALLGPRGQVGLPMHPTPALGATHSSPPARPAPAVFCPRPPRPPS